MFRKNTKHTQGSLFSAEFMLSEDKRKKLAQSEEQAFYELVFRKIKEEDFACLYSNDDSSRPNAPINAMVSALILMHRRNWTYDQLFNEIDFNLLTRTALGLLTLDETPFCAASLFNFQNRVNEYGIKTGVNLFESIFDHLTAQELKALKLKTSIQRTDSMSAASNIRNFGRLQLLVEVLIRVHRVLNEDDKEFYKDKFHEFIKNSSSQYMYHFKRDDTQKKLEDIGQLYHWISKNLASKYVNVEIFKTFDIVYHQHFTVVDEKATVVPAERLTSGMVQSPDDIDATYRKKADKESKGCSISIVETAHPDNALNLITDVAVAKNNVDDSVILNSRLNTLKEKTPELEQLHMDGAYGSEANDTKMKELNIVPIQTAIKGPAPRIPITINKTGDTTYSVSCPIQYSASEISGKRHKVYFELKVCATCPHAGKCQLMTIKHSRVYYFTDADYLRKQRHENINTLTQSYRNIRSNVEATICELSNKLRKCKLKVRGFFKTSVFAYAMAVSVNFGRIYRHLVKQGDFRLCGTSVFAFYAATKPYIARFSIFKELKVIREIFTQYLIARLAPAI